MCALQTTCRNNALFVCTQVNCVFTFFSFVTSTGMGFEAFFTQDCFLVIAVIIKKEFHTLLVMDKPLIDGHWVS